ncbi:metabolite traffic protein EboE [Oscillatoria salina]|uniref:metabolite traffic protein EboE n=1 Tax=Oscillatoria salina TaxID=331517 RepID=UPI0013B8146C|nr:metabolite traffic protein EboE [Oscillatoria salina]MBZ8178885.1 metabolite traffic protein EboE [Oscillatoria salina IIICB1]NET86689.1 metabolite traffic protein EboE [Kamptonema sp. SIO1D9]
MKIDENFHLTYCTNIHPGETWSEVLTNLKQYIPVLKNRLSPTQPFGIGLRLADAATRELLAGNNLAAFQSWLSGQNLYVFTLNGFPYGGFHQQVVKDKVYAPDWSKPERLDYTIRLVKILASLLPAGIDGGISTVPLSYKPWWQKEKYLGEIVLKESSLNLARLTAEMVRIRQETGKLLHLDLEPEPDGQIENTAEVIDYFQKNLLPIGGSFLAEKLAISPELAEQHLREHIRICYDTCHFAVEYEDPNRVFQRLEAAGIKIGKIQISAAIKVSLPAEAEGRKRIQQRLSPFAESTYLHQVIERLPDREFYHYQDLVTALPYLENTSAKEWRTHFHVPIFIADYHLLQSTQDDIVTVLNLLQDNPVCNHLEIETYTWDVLPAEIKIDLLASIEREYEWVLGVINSQKN